MYELYLDTDLVNMSLDSLNESKTHLETAKGKIDAGYATLSGCKGIEYADLSGLKKDIKFLGDSLKKINDIINEIKKSEEEIIEYDKDPTIDIFDEEGLKENVTLINLDPFLNKEDDKESKKEVQLISLDVFESKNGQVTHDITKLPANIQKNMKIESFHGEDVLVPKSYLMSLESYEKFIEREGLSQHKYLQGECKSFAGIHAMGLFSKEALIRMDSKSKNLLSISPDYYYCDAVISQSKSAIEKAAIEELTNGRPPILQVTQKVQGSRHWVALVGLKADAVFNACESGTLDASKITREDQIVIDNAYAKNPIGSMDKYNREYYGRWGQSAKDPDQYRIQVINLDRINKTVYAREMKQSELGKYTNLEARFLASK